MFVHSVKVPRLYKVATNVIKGLKDDKNLRKLVDNANHPNKKAITALVLKTMQHREIIDKLFESSQILKKENGLDETLAAVLTTELLWGKKSLFGESKPLVTMNKYRDEFLKRLDSDEFQDAQTQRVETIWRPRYVRINTLQASPEDVIEKFVNENWTLLPTAPDYGTYLSDIRTNLKQNNFVRDIHVKEMLAFPFGTVFAHNQLYHDGVLVLQDKASCLVTHILNPSLDSIVLDMCSAPGMKTTHLAAHMQNTGSIYAVEKNRERYEFMKKMISQSKATNILPICSDAFKITRKQFPKIDYILLDAPCSGSGMLKLAEFNADIKSDNSSLRKQSNINKNLLLHAMTEFGDVERIVYSTCSLYEEENEQVVEGVLKRVNNFKLIDCAQFFNGWINRGSDAYECGQKCMRASPSADCTNGFFIAAFERVS